MQISSNIWLSYDFLFYISGYVNNSLSLLLLIMHFQWSVYIHMFWFTTGNHLQNLKVWLYEVF